MAEPIKKVTVELAVPKEAMEVVDFLDAVLEKVMSGAPINEYASIFTDIIPAIEGIQNVPNELKSDGKDEIAAYLVHKLMGRLLPSEKPAE